jgi:hypothetical protein
MGQWEETKTSVRNVLLKKEPGVLGTSCGLVATPIAMFESNGLRTDTRKVNVLLHLR